MIKEHIKDIFTHINVVIKTALEIVGVAWLYTLLPSNVSDSIVMKFILFIALIMILKDGLSKAFNNNLYAHNILNEMLDEFNSHEYIRNTTVFINALYKNECLQKMNAVKIDIINNEEIIEQFNEKKNGLKDEIKNELDSIELLKEYYKSK